MAVQQDGWWLSGPPHKDTTAKPAQTGLPNTGRLWLLLALIALGDHLVWQVVPGLSLTVFGAALVLAALCSATDKISQKRAALVGGLGLLSILPLIELVQPLSLLIAALGLTAALVLVAGIKPPDMLRAALRLWPLGVAATGFETLRLKKSNGGVEATASLKQAIMLWVMPVVMGLIFVILLLAANPIAANWLDGLSKVSFNLPTPERLIFWAALIPLGWTVLSLPLIKERLRAAPKPRAFGPAPEGVINAGSTTRALILFNGVFAVQTLMDVFYLYGGAALPEGMTYATYAHRGAYPLLVTALLAGGFALLTRRWTNGNDLLRGLLIAWVIQNIALVVSSLVRLDLYVDIYGLTRLRMAAAIWMGLVAVGLVLIVWQVWRGHRSAWLLLRVSALAAVVLYICSFASFDAKIARHNLGRVAPGSIHFLNQGTIYDEHYLCRLGDAAKPILRDFELIHSKTICHERNMQIVPPADWREWGFRNARARHSLAALNAEARP